MKHAYFSPTTPGFYPELWKSDGSFSNESWPADAVLLTEEEAITYWKQSPPDGKRLGEINGRPAWVDLPPLSLAQEIALAEQHKALLLNTATSKIVIWQTKLLMGRKLTDNETTQLNSWVDYIDSITVTDTTTAPDIFWPEQPQ